MTTQPHTHDKLRVDHLQPPATVWAGNYLSLDCDNTPKSPFVLMRWKKDLLPTTLTLFLVETFKRMHGVFVCTSSLFLVLLHL